MYPIEEFLLRTPRVSLLPGQTPFHRMARFCSDLSTTAYIKRDDMTGIGPGGNKIRSLEFLLGQAMDEKCDCILVAGPGQSNLCTLTAAACARLGLECEVIHNCDCPDVKQGNLLLNHLLHVKSHFLGPVTSEERGNYVERLLKDYKNQGKRPFVIRNGATNGRGALGYTAAILELKEQCRQQEISDMTIFAPGGNGGVAAGLVYGNTLMGNPFHIVIVSVEDEKSVLESHIQTTVHEAEEITGIPCPTPINQLCEITDAYRGGGWGENTTESSCAAEEFPCLEGIFVENVYNSKVLVGMRDWIKKAKVSGPVCYLHTGGFGSLFSQY